MTIVMPILMMMAKGDVYLIFGDKFVHAVASGGTVFIVRPIGMGRGGIWDERERDKMGWMGWTHKEVNNVCRFMTQV